MGSVSLNLKKTAVAADSSKPARFASPVDRDLALCRVGPTPYPPGDSAPALPPSDAHTMSSSSRLRKTPAPPVCHPAYPPACPAASRPPAVALQGARRTAAFLLLLLAQTGCTSVLTTGSLRDLLWKGAEHAATREPAGDGDPAAETASTESTASVDGETDAGPQGDAGRRTAAIEEAVARLARLGRLDAASESTLVTTLQRTQPEDWPVVIDAFAAALPPPEPARDALESKPDTSFPPDADAAAVRLPPQPAEEPKPHSAARPVPMAAAVALTAPEPPAAQPAAAQVPAPAVPLPAPAAEPAPADQQTEAGPSPAPLLKMQHACFASRVRGWGDVERFADARFEAGQEVIVYFELDGLVVEETPAGCTTRIDTVLTLVGPDGSRLHAWRFDPLEETCKQRRRDYFARYLVRLPETAAGRCRLEVSVSDTLARNSTGTTLPLDIAAAPRDGR